MSYWPFAVLDQQIQDNIFAAQFRWVDTGVSDRDHDDRGHRGEHGVDERRQQLRVVGEQALEDEVVLGVEQVGHPRFGRQWA